MSETILFAFGIRGVEIGKEIVFVPFAKRAGIPEEVVFTVMRQWLKSREKDYRNRLTD